MDPRFDRHYISEYIRALETGVHLDLPNARWYREYYLRERDWGQLDLLSHEERHTKFSEEMSRRERDGFYWAPPGGESMAHLCLRVDRVLNTFHRECSDKRVVSVNHGGVMIVFRVRLERMSQAQFYELDRSRDPKKMIHNCQIIHYTRRDPESGQLRDYFHRVRSICPWDTSLSHNEWEVIQRKKYSNEELMAEVSNVPRLVNETIS